MMTWLHGNIVCLALVILLLSAGCGAKPEANRAVRPNWEPATGELTPAPEFNLPQGENPAALPPPPFNARDFAIELSKLSSRAASDIAGLRAEAQNEASFPEEASAMLEEVAATLRSIAGKGYEPLELQLADDYAQYARKVGALEDTIRLGKSMEYALGRDVVAYYQLNSTKMNELKKAYWEKKLKRLRDELAGERSRFNFAKQAMLLAQAAEIGARQRAEINRLEDDLNALALDYAEQVRSAVNKAAEPLMQMNIASGVLSGEYDSKVDEFDADFKARFEKAKMLAGS